MRCDQSRWNWWRIAAIKYERRRVHNQIDVRDLKSNRRFLPSNRLQARHRSKNFRAGEKFAQSFSKLFCFCKITIGNDKTFAIFFCALHRNRTPCSTRTKHEHAQIAKINRKFVTYGARKSASVRVESTRSLSIK